MNHYPRHIGDFAAATVGMTLVERGAYNALLDQYYVHEKPLPLDAREVQRMAAATSKVERDAVLYVLGKFFHKLDDGWHQKRADAEIERYQAKAGMARQNGHKGGRPNNQSGFHDGNRNITEVVSVEETGSKANQNQNQNHEPEPRTTGVEPPPSKSVATAPAKPAGDVAAMEAKRASARAVWDAYSTAYEARYHAEPTRNAKINRCVLDFLNRVPADEAPHIAAHFLRSNNAFYVTKGHQFPTLLADAEKLRTEWATNRSVTATEARQGDRTAATGNVFRELIDEARNAQG